jgi:transcriptional regulator with XRE-family HTH domain
MNQHEFLARVGKNIRNLRLARGLHGAILADKIGIPVKAINGIEEGLIATSLTDIYDIAMVLEVDPRELFK